MTNHSGNHLLQDGFELPEAPAYTKPIPPAAITSIVNDAMTGQHTCPSCIALEEANQALARRVVSLSNEARELRDRLDGREFD